MRRCSTEDFNCKSYYGIDNSSWYYGIDLWSNGRLVSKYSIPVLEDVTKKILKECFARVLKYSDSDFPNKTIIDSLTEMQGWFNTQDVYEGKLLHQGQTFLYQVAAWFDPKNIASEFMGCFDEKLRKWDKDSDASIQRQVWITLLCMVLVGVILLAVLCINRHCNFARSECFTSSSSNDNNRGNWSWLFGSSNSNNNAGSSSSLQDEVDDTHSGSFSKNSSGGWLTWFCCKTTKDINENSPLKEFSGKVPNSDFSAHLYGDEIPLDTTYPSSPQS